MNSRRVSVTQIGLCLFFAVIICRQVEAQVKAQEVLDAAPQEYCEKLDKHVKFLEKFHKLNKKHSFVDFDSYGGFSFVIKKIEYNNEIVKICIEKMLELSSLEPLLKTWEYAYSLCISNKDMGFVREFSILIFSVYEHCLVLISSKRLDKGLDTEIKSTLEDIIQVYNAVSDLPIREIIIMLEKCYRLFSRILRDHGVYSTMSWKQWFIKYWWFVPTVTLAVVAALLRRKLSRPSFGRITKD